MVPNLEEEGWQSFEEYEECPAAIPVNFSQAHTHRDREKGPPNIQEE